MLLRPVEDVLAIAASRMGEENVLVLGTSGDFLKLVRAIVGPDKVIVAIHITTGDSLPYPDIHTTHNVIVISSPTIHIDYNIFNAHGIMNPWFDLILYREHLPSVLPEVALPLLRRLKYCLAPNGRIVLPMWLIYDTRFPDEFLRLTSVYSEPAELAQMPLVAVNGFPFTPTEDVWNAPVYEAQAYEQSLENVAFNVHKLYCAAASAEEAGSSRLHENYFHHPSHIHIYGGYVENTDGRYDAEYFHLAAEMLRDATAIWRRELCSYDQSPPPGMDVLTWVKNFSPMVRIFHQQMRHFGTYIFSTQGPVSSMAATLPTNMPALLPANAPTATAATTAFTSIPPNIFQTWP